MTKKGDRRVFLAVDFVLLSLAPDKKNKENKKNKKKGLEVLLLERSGTPHKGTYTLPGAFVRLDEDRDLSEAIDRILKEKVLIPIGKQDWENQQLGCFYSKERDERNVATVVYWGLISKLKREKFNEDNEDSATSKSLKFSPLGDYKNLGGKKELPFDHTTILKKAIERLSETMELKSTATKFFDKELTTRDLRLAYETVWDYSDEKGEIDQSNFAQFLKKQTQAFSLYQPDTTSKMQTTFYADESPKGRPALNWIRDLDVLEDKKLEYPLPRKPRRSKPKKS